MGAVKQLLRRQRKLGESIDSASQKYVKAGISKRTENYFHNRLGEIQQWWSEFRANDKAITTTEETCGEKQAYTAEKYFEVIKGKKEEIVKQYMAYAAKAYPRAKFIDVDQDDAENDESSDEDENDDENDEENGEEENGEEETEELMNDSSLHSTRLFELASRLEKRTMTSKLYDVRGSTLYDLAHKLALKHQNATMEVELNFDIEKLKHALNQFLAAMEDRILIASDGMEIEGVRMEAEDAQKAAERTLFTLINKQSEQTQKKSAAPEAPKLQALRVPKFDGNYQKWVPFLNLFTKVVHENGKLNNVQRMQYLLDCLEGEPRRIIQHLDLTENNYESAIGLLKKRYNDERKIISKYLDAIIDHPNVGDDVKGLKSIVDLSTESLHAIKNQGVKEKELASMLWMRIIEKKLDMRTRRFFESTLTDKRKMPQLENLMNFLEERFIGMENLWADDERPHAKNSTKHEGNGIKRGNCPVCSGQHRIHQCPKYNGMTAYDRNEAVKKAKLCRNCLGSHETNKCNASGTCGRCSRFHHTSLHFEAKKGEKQERSERDSAQAHIAVKSDAEYDVLLATAVIQAQNEDGKFIELRALIDQGSTTSFISEDAVQRLRVKRRKTATSVSGIGATGAGKSQGCSTIKLKPRYPSSFEISADALILKKLTTFTPGDLSERKWEHTDGLVLADPSYNKSGKIDIILGADIFGAIVLSGLVRGPPDTPIAQETEFGWILSGRWNRGHKMTKAVGLISNAQIDERLETFWRIEDMPEKKDSMMTEDERRCEEFFQQTHRRNIDGQYVTRLPFKTHEFCLGKSRNIAIATLMQMEKKFRREPALKAEYAKCINEYLELGHMELARTQDEAMVTYRDGKKHYNCYYLPHHAVLKTSSTTTKLRVVFNASQKTSSGLSLNDVMLVGPTIQDDLMDILLRWRKHRIALTADIEKMYRQFLVDDADVDYQRIVWRNSEDEPIRDYRIKRVFFGNASAPFVAIRTVRQLARDEREKYPMAAAVTERDFYVDDLITGAHTVDEAIGLQHQLRELMSAGCLNLRKWATNATECLAGIPDEHREVKDEIEINNATIKMLGVQWDPRMDNFKYHIKLGEERNEYTKRKIVSEVAQLFDPLGWLAPVVVRAKMQLQELWIDGLDWDTPVPQQINEKWRSFRRTLTELDNISIPRYVGLGYENATYELHGFCDASTKAYAAAVYLRSVYGNGEVTVNLLVAKSRVAPTKTLSIPRLELCGALLLANLMVKTNAALRMKLRMNAWTDSMVALAWINGSPQRWETFVANRVTKICDLVSSEKWRHVGTKDNPADVASRGMDAADLRECKIWWYGPTWLSANKLIIEPTQIEETSEGERKIALAAVCDSEYQNFIHRFSSYDKVVRVLAYCLRFAANCKIKKAERHGGPVKMAELRKADHALIRWAQRVDFEEDIQLLESQDGLSLKSSIITLNPFLEDGILRVRGRIQSDNLPYARRHPMIISYGNPLTTLIIDSAHKKTLHGGNQLTLSFIRQRFWILKAKRAVKTVIRKCVKCFKYRAQARQQMMGNLPHERTTEARPFTNTGVDFCGPFDIKNMVGRGSRTSKGYVAIFICLATKAIHIEVVSDLTSDAFIAAFKRMIGRRGAVAHMFSDNGTNFVGANRIIQAEFREFMNECCDEIITELTKVGTEWHFIPPSAPHFGGLWEAGVKSIKHHLKRVIGDTKLTYEELSTVLCQIEACLNSRPLCPISEDPDDLQVLTPGHFLIGEAPTMPLETDYQWTPINRLKRWQLCSKIHQDFWRVWKDEYLSRLQQRTKWLQKTENVKVGNMVLVKDERTPSSAWPMGRIIETHGGRDNLVRVVDVRIGKKIFRRPITKICVLPIRDNLESNGAGRDDDVKSSSKKAPIKTSVLLTVALLLGLIAAAAGNPLIKIRVSTTERTLDSLVGIQRFMNNPIAYVERIGDSQVVNGNWNLLVFYELREYFDECKRIQTGVSQLGKRCQDIGYDCTALTAQFAHRLRRIQETNEFLLSGHGNIRKKRQLLVAAGGLLAGGVAVYGWLTKHEADNYSQAIDGLKSNQDHLLDLLRNQTSVLELTDDLIKKTTLQMENEHRNIYDSIEKLDHAGQTAELGWKLHNVALQLSLMMEEYAAVQDHIIETITTVHQGRLHPALVSPAKMQEQVDAIRGYIGQECELPSTLASIYGLAQVKVRFADAKLIFRVSIPILKAAAFQMWRIIPIPQAINGTFTEIRSTSEFMLMDRANGTYYDMTTRERSACDEIDGRLICRIRHPLYKPGASLGRCEMAIIHNETASHIHCPTQNVFLDERWTRLSDAHSFVFTINGTKSYNVSCPTLNQRIHLRGSGVLRLNGNCALDGDSMHITTSQLETKMVTGYVISSNLSWALERNQITVKGLAHHVNTTQLDIALRHLRLDTAKQLLDVSIHDWHQYGIIYGLLMISATIYAYRRCSRPRLSHAGFIVRTTSVGRENVRTSA